MLEINFGHATICNLRLGHLLVGCDLKIIKASWFDWRCARDDNFVWFSIWKLRNRVPVLTVYYSQVLLHLLNLNSSGTEHYLHKKCSDGVKFLSMEGPSK